MNTLRSAERTNRERSPLPGYTWDNRSGRYRSSDSGRFVPRKDILGLLEATTTATEKQTSVLTNAVMEGRIAVSVWQEQMRSEVKNQVLQQTALGSGGWDRISQSAYGRAGADLRDLYARISGTAADIMEGKISMAQAMARANEYAGHARSHFYSAEREKVVVSAPGKVFIERRVLGGSGDTCPSCVEYYDQGWSNLGSLPVPGTQSECRGNCRCQMFRKEVDASDLGEWLGSKR